MDRVLEAAQIIATSRRNRAALKPLPPEVAPKDEADGYRVQRAVHDLLLPRTGALVGYKIGCTSRASENAETFVDDIAFQRAYHSVDPGDRDVFTEQMRHFGDWAPQHQQRLRDRFVTAAPTEAPQAVRAVCEVSRALAPRLGLPECAVRALAEVKERVDQHLFEQMQARLGELEPLQVNLHDARQRLACLERDLAGAVAALRKVEGELVWLRPWFVFMGCVLRPAWHRIRDVLWANPSPFSERRLNEGGQAPT